ncbi:AAA family ATPase [Pseudomonadota bacterium]
MNAKGGCGKTTLATNLASYYAAHGYRTALFDYDPQCSSSQWLKRRSEALPVIQGIEACQKGNSTTRSWLMRLSPDTERVVIDTPAGVKPHDAVSYLRGVSTILVPVLSSVIDVEASAQFVQELMKLPTVRTNQTKVVVVANRVKSRAPALKIMKEIFSDMGVPVTTQLRDTMSYVQGTDTGTGIQELPSNKAKMERRAWQKLVKAIDPEFVENRDMLGDAMEISAIKSITDKPIRDIPLSIPLAEVGRYSVSWK